MRNVTTLGYQRKMPPDATRSPGDPFTFVFSTPSGARDNCVIDQATWRLENFRANPVVLDTHYGDAVGTASNLRLEDGCLVGDVAFDVAGERGAELDRQHAAGLRNCVSVRWAPGETIARNALPKAHPAYSTTEGWRGVGLFYKNCDLLEVSSVTLPGDPGAVQKRAEDTEDEDLGGYSWGFACSDEFERAQQGAAALAPAKRKAHMQAAGRRWLAAEITAALREPGPQAGPLQRAIRVAGASDAQPADESAAAAAARIRKLTESLKKGTANVG